MTYALGAQVVLTWTPASTQSAAVLTVTLPDGTSSTPTVSGTTTFTATYTPTLTGRHEVMWVGTGTPARTFGPDAFEVTAITRGPVVSLADAKTHLGLTGTTYDEQLLPMLTDVSDIVEAEVGRPLRRTVVTDTFSGQWKPALNLRAVACPCVTCLPFRTLTLTTVTEDGTTLTSSDYTLSVNSGVLYRGATTLALLWSGLAPSNIAVTYTTGYTRTPRWAQLAVLRAVENMWTRTQQRPHPGMGQAPDTDFVPSMNFVLPYAVQSLLEPHKAPGF